MTISRPSRAIMLALLVLCGSSLVSSFAAVGPALLPHRERAVLQLHGGARSNDLQHEGGGELKDYTAAASGLFQNLRIPAALFAGAAAASAFALPLAEGEGVKLGFVKRIYAILMMGSLSSQLIAIVVSTVTMVSIANREVKETSSLAEYVNEYCDFEWVTARYHFLSGLLLFALGEGMRAWISIVCPVIGKTALGIVLSSTLLSLAFIDSVERQNFEKGGLVQLPFLYLKLLVRKVRTAKGPLYLAAIVTGVITTVYLGMNVAHIYHYLATTQQCS